MQQDDILRQVRKWCYNFRQSQHVIWRMRGSEKYRNGNSFIRRRGEFFYSSLVNKSPVTSSSVTLFPSSPSSQSEEDSGRTGRVARDFFFATLALGLPPTLVIAMGMGMGMGVCFANHSSRRWRSDSSTCLDTIVREAWSISCFRASNLATQSVLSSDTMREVLGGLRGAQVGSFFSKTGSLCAASVSDSFDKMIEIGEGGKTHMLTWSGDSVSKVSSLYFASTLEQSSDLILEQSSVVLRQLRLCFGFSRELTPANRWAGQATLGFRPHLAGSG
jgi:hypothetical protein